MGNTTSTESRRIVVEIAKEYNIDLSDIVVHDNRTFTMILKNPTLGLGESYMQKMWDCDNLDCFLTNILIQKINIGYKQILSIIYNIIKDCLLNPQSQSESIKNVQHHYDVSSPIFKYMLDKRMIYSCAYWDNAKNIDEAQEAKLKLICDKLKLKSGMKVLDIGCGWGGFARYAAKEYGVKIVGITLSRKQYEYCIKHSTDETHFILCDYRDLTNDKDLCKSFDRIVSIGMFEHVGVKNYKTFMEVHRYLLKDDGLIMLHTIAGNKSKTRGDPWFSKYIFPNGMLPSLKQISESCEDCFVIEDVENLGPHYDLTLMAWYKRWKNNLHNIDVEEKREQSSLLESSIRKEEFIRMWDFYLLFSAALFRSRRIQLLQIVLSKGIVNGYKRF